MRLADFRLNNRVVISNNNNNNNNNNNEFLYRIETHQCVTLLSLGSCQK